MVWPIPASGQRLGWLYRGIGDWDLHAGRWHLQNTVRDALQDSHSAVKGQAWNFSQTCKCHPTPQHRLDCYPKSEPEVGLNVDEKRVQDHMPRAVKLDGTDKNTNLLGALVHWVMRNNLLTIVNKYPAIQASRDFDVSYSKLKRVTTGKKQTRGSYYERQCREQEGKQIHKWGKKRKAVNPVDAALAKKKKVTLSVDTTECKYCGKLYHTGKKLTEHINQEHPGEQTIYACPYCTQPFNQYSEYLQHLGEHKDRIIRCRICNKEFKTITKLSVHTKTHVNQCPFCSENFPTHRLCRTTWKRTMKPTQVLWRGNAPCASSLVTA